LVALAKHYEAQTASAFRVIWVDNWGDKWDQITFIPGNFFKLECNVEAQV